MSAGHLHHVSKSGPEELAKLLSDPNVRPLLAAKPRVDTSYDLPYLSGHSTDGGVIYIDRDVPAMVSIAGREIPLDSFLIAHELIEKSLLAGLSYSYEAAHDLATTAEHVRAKAAGITVKQYEETLRQYIKAERPSKLIRLPPDLDLAPYANESNVELLRLLRTAVAADPQRHAAATDHTTDSESLTSLHKNPFWILWASTRDSQQRIVELAEEKSLLLDDDVCQKARSDLTNPRSRLSAEISWLPGVSPNRAWQTATALRGGFVGSTLDAGLPPLARSNVLSAALEALPSDTNQVEIAERILSLAKASDEINAPQVLRQINEDRSVARFPLITREDVVEEELSARRSCYNDAIKASLDRLPTAVLVQVLTDVTERATGTGSHHAPQVIERLVASYETEAQHFIEAETRNVQLLLTRARSEVRNGENSVGRFVGSIEKVIDNWNRVMRPIQIVSKTKGVDHSQSRDIAFEVRDLSIHLHNDHGMVATAEAITGMLQSKFAALPEFAERAGEDADSIRESSKAADLAKEQQKEWEQEITYSAEIGLLVKESLSISPAGIRWRNRLYPLETINRIRWGGTRHSVNGIPTGTSYEIYFGGDSGDCTINLRKSEIFSSFIDKLWRATGVRLFVQHLARLKAGEKIRFGEAIVEDDAVVLLRHKPFWSTEPVRLGWYQVHVWSAEGAFVIGAKDDKKVYVTLPYLKVSNVQVLENMIRAFFKTGKPNLSSLLDS